MSQMNERNTLEKPKKDAALAKEQRSQPSSPEKLEKPSPKTHVLLKLDFKKAFISLNREPMLKHSNDISPLYVYPLAFSAYCKPSYLIYGDTIISSKKGTQQGDPEAPPLLADTIQVLVNDMRSKIMTGT